MLGSENIWKVWIIYKTWSQFFLSLELFLVLWVLYLFFGSYFSSTLCYPTDFLKKCYKYIKFQIMKNPLFLILITIYVHSLVDFIS
jgi:hypothetical protein